MSWGQKKENEAKALRRAGYTLDEIADKIGVPSRTTERWLRGVLPGTPVSVVEAGAIPTSEASEFNKSLLRSWGIPYTTMPGMLMVNFSAIPGTDKKEAPA